MDPQLSAVLGVPPAAVTPEIAALTTATGAPQSFANTFQDALDDLAMPDTPPDGALALTLALSATLDDGNHSPQSGNDSPLLLQLLDLTGMSPQVFAAADDAADDPMPKMTLPDPGVEFIDAVTQGAQTVLPAALMAAQVPVVNIATSLISTAPARASVSVPTVTSVFAPNPFSLGQEPPTVTMHPQAQTTSQDPQARQQHTPQELELLTSVASVLVPVQERSAECFEGAVAAILNTPTPDAATVNTGTFPLNSSAIIPSNAAATPVAATSGKFDLAIPQAPGQPGWSDVFAERVTFAVRQNLQEAEIRLHPPQLGQVEVRIVMSNDQASLMFSSPQGAVREAIELSLGRLRDMLADSGFNLVNVDVSDKSLAQQRNNAREQHESGGGGSQMGYRADFEFAANAPEVVRAIGSIDYYV